MTDDATLLWTPCRCGHLGFEHEPDGPCLLEPECGCGGWRG